jgi:hypothetical protein
VCHHLLVEKVGDLPLLDVAGGDKEVAGEVRATGDDAAAIALRVIADTGTHAVKGNLGSSSLSFGEKR